MNLIIYNILIINFYILLLKNLKIILNDKNIINIIKKNIINHKFISINILSLFLLLIS